MFILTLYCLVKTLFNFVYVWNIVNLISVQVIYIQITTSEIFKSVFTVYELKIVKIFIY